MVILAQCGGFPMGSLYERPAEGSAGPAESPHLLVRGERAISGGSGKLVGNALDKDQIRDLKDQVRAALAESRWRDVGGSSSDFLPLEWPAELAVDLGKLLIGLSAKYGDSFQPEFDLGTGETTEAQDRRDSLPSQPITLALRQASNSA